MSLAWFKTGSVIGRLHSHAGSHRRRQNLILILFFDLIHDMKSDPNMVINDSQPDIELVFIGPSVKLISTDMSDFDQQEREALNRLADKIASMNQDGIEFEICMVAAHSVNVDPDTILPESTA